MAAAGLLAIALIVVVPPIPVVGMVVFAIWLLVPGWAVVSRLGIADAAARSALTMVTGIMIAAITSLVMVWSAFWHPEVAAVAVLLAASSALASFPRPEATDIRTVVRTWAAATRSHVDRTGPFGWALWGLLVVGLVLWLVALGLTSSDALDRVGVALVFPALWYAAAAVVLLVAVASFSLRRSSRSRSAAAVVLLNGILYASATAVQAVPQPAWAYKHFAVSDLIDATGRVDPGIDIYNRWPGFFSTSAFLGRAAGFPHAIDWAAWSDVGFSLFGALAVFAIARTITRTAAAQWTAALVFTLGNWIGQNYYSPQAFGYSLYLSMCLVAFLYLRGAPIRPLESLERRLESRRVLAAPAARRWPFPDSTTKVPAPSTPSRSARIGAIMVVLGLQCVIVASHQLTPYIAIACLVPLFFLGYLRPGWVGIGLVGAALLFLLPNLDYIDSKYGLLSSFDPVSNAVFTPDEAVNTTADEIRRGRGVALLSLTVFAFGFLGFLRRALSGDVRLAVMAAVLAFAPAVILAGQNYGGEGRFRVYLFALPWLAIGVGWFFEAGARWSRSAAVARVLVLTVMLGLFTGTYYQVSTLNRVFAQDVTAAEWLDQRLLPGDFLIGEVGTFPTLIGSHYPIVLSQPPERWFLSIDTRTGSDFFDYSEPGTDAADVEYAVESVGGLGHTYFVFADSQRPLLDPDVVALLDGIESTMQGDAGFERIYSQSGVRIYRVDGPAGP